jgi:DNA-binding CsgD family transcriptional regulator
MYKGKVLRINLAIIATVFCFVPRFFCEPGDVKMPESTRLTLRETEVLTHVVEGRVNGEISADLGISERTVEKHLESIYKKLGVESRTAAVIKYFSSHARQLKSSVLDQNTLGETWK